ncbi:MAG TPA: hypothetical protein VFX61_20000 [Micromonosporaceae bacterium]|nr:hypothetical protein [Micromonosporaceae bacterium]
MAARRRTAGAKLPNDGRKVGLVVGLAVVACMVPVGFFSLDSDDTTVPAPETTQSADTVEILRKAAEAQGVCYGWQLNDSSSVVSAGSNLGDGRSVTDDPTSCPRWVEVSANIVYTSAESEIDDYATFRVMGSADLTDVTSIALEGGLRRLGIDESAFVEDPGWAVTRAAVLLPLLMAEQGEAPVVPVSTDSPAAEPSPLPAAGSDMWRDRSGYLLAGAAMLLLTALLAGIGGWQWQRERQRAALAPAPRRTRSGTRGADKPKANPRKPAPRKAAAAEAVQDSPRKAPTPEAVETPARKAAPRKAASRKAASPQAPPEAVEAAPGKTTPRKTAGQR